MKKIIILVIAVAVIIGGGYLYDVLKQQGLENATADWQVYHNDEYGFELKYPAFLGYLKDDTDPTEKINCDSPVYNQMQLASACRSHSCLLLVFSCQSAGDKQLRDGANHITVAGKDSLYFSSSRVGTETREVLVPFNDKFEVEISYFSATESNYRNYPELSAVDFNQILSTFKFTK